MDIEQVRDQQRLTWDRLSAGWRKWDRLVVDWLGPYGAAMLRGVHVREDSQVLDVAAGTGEPGLTAAALVPEGNVIMTDLAVGMLEVAADKAARRGLSNVETRMCDAGELPFGDARFDAVLCRFGFMFFPDITAAAAEFARVTKSGGRVCAAVWSEPAMNPWATTIMAAIARHVSLPAPEADTPGLFRCSSPQFLRDLFTDAGLHDISEEQVSCDMVHISPEQYWDFMTAVAAPVVAGLAKLDSATQEQVKSEVVATARQFTSEGTIRIPSAARVVAGTR